MTLPILLFALAAQTPARAVLLPIQPVDEVPGRVGEKLDELLSAQIPSVPLALPTAPPELETRARAAYVQGIEAYRSMSFGRSIELLSQAIELLEEGLDRIKDVELLVSAQIDLGVALLAEKKTSEAERALARAVALRPDLQLSIDKYPPRVIQTFEKVKKSQLAKDRARLSLSSSPGFAQVEVDGIGRGDTPLTVELLPGKHRWVVKKEGHLPNSGIVTLAAAEEHVEVTLPEDPIRRAGAAIAESVSGKKTIDEGIAAARELAAALGVDEVVVPAIATEGEGYLLALARISSGTRTVAWSRTDRDLANAYDAVRELAAGKTGAPSPRIDPSRSLAGIVAPQLIEPPIAPPEPESSNAIWWWIGIGGAVVVAAAAGTTAYFLTRPDETAGGDNIFVVLRNPGTN